MIATISSCVVGNGSYYEANAAWIEEIIFPTHYCKCLVSSYVLPLASPILHEISVCSFSTHYLSLRNFPITKQHITVVFFYLVIYFGKFSAIFSGIPCDKYQKRGFVIFFSEWGRITFFQHKLKLELPSVVLDVEHKMWSPDKVLG